MIQVINQGWWPSHNYKVHKCGRCPKDYVVLVWPEEDVACVAKIYDYLPEHLQCGSSIYECMTLPSEDSTVYYCPWCGEEVLKDDNYVA